MRPLTITLLWAVLLGGGCDEAQVHSSQDTAIPHQDSAADGPDAPGRDGAGDSGTSDGVGPGDGWGEVVPCGGANCNDHLPCTDDHCVASGCQNLVQPGFCVIKNTCYTDGTMQAGSSCGRCLASKNNKGWSDDVSLCKDDGAACTTTACSAGACAHQLQSGYCLVGGACLKDGASSPINGCLHCTTAVSTTTLQVKSDGVPCSDDMLGCTSDTCQTGKCSHALLKGQCLINGACYSLAELHPSVDCNLCMPGISTSKWSAAPDGVLCTADKLVCTEDVCKSGACSHPLQNNTCLIHSACYSLGQKSAANDCLLCQPSSSPLKWTVAKNGAPCSGGTCLTGACCKGCISGGTCVTGTTNAECGEGGKPCLPCTPGHKCVNHQCQYQGSNPLTLSIGNHNSTYSSSQTRGYWFTAPASFTIVGLRVPTDGTMGSGPQNIQVMRFNSIPPDYSSSTTSFTTLLYLKGVPGTGWNKVNIPVHSGQIIGVLGARGTSTMNNSYGSGNPYSSSISGKPVSLKRLVYQANLYSSAAGPLSTESGGSYCRIEMQYF